MDQQSPKDAPSQVDDQQEEIKRLKERVAFLEAQLPTEKMLKKEYSTLRLGSCELQLLRKDIINTCDKKAIWKGKISGDRGAYPNVLRRTAFGAADVARGLRKSNAVMFTCSHVVLIANGQHPTSYGMHASHLCHETRCLNIDHIRWELRYINEERNRCIGLHACICGQLPPCMPNAHASA